MNDKQIQATSQMEAQLFSQSLQSIPQLIHENYCEIYLTDGVKRTKMNVKNTDTVLEIKRQYVQVIAVNGESIMKQFAYAVEKTKECCIAIDSVTVSQVSETDMLIFSVGGQVLDDSKNTVDDILRMQTHTETQVDVLVTLDVPVKLPVNTVSNLNALENAPIYWNPRTAPPGNEINMGVFVGSLENALKADAWRRKNIAEKIDASGFTLKIIDFSAKLELTEKNLEYVVIPAIIAHRSCIYFYGDSKTALGKENVVYYPKLTKLTNNQEETARWQNKTRYGSINNWNYKEFDNTLSFIRLVHGAELVCLQRHFPSDISIPTGFTVATRTVDTYEQLLQIPNTETPPLLIKYNQKTSEGNITPVFYAYALPKNLIHPPILEPITTKATLENNKDVDNYLYYNPTINLLNRSVFKVRLKDSLHVSPITNIDLYNNIKHLQYNTGRFYEKPPKCYMVVVAVHANHYKQDISYASAYHDMLNNKMVAEGIIGLTGVKANQSFTEEGDAVGFIQHVVIGYYEEESNVFYRALAKDHPLYKRFIEASKVLSINKHIEMLKFIATPNPVQPLYPQKNEKKEAQTNQFILEEVENGDVKVTVRGKLCALFRRYVGDYLSFSGGNVKHVSTEYIPGTPEVSSLEFLIKHSVFGGVENSQYCQRKYDYFKNNINFMHKFDITPSEDANLRMPGQYSVRNNFAKFEIPLKLIGQPEKLKEMSKGLDDLIVARIKTLFAPITEVPDSVNSSNTFFSLPSSSRSSTQVNSVNSSGSFSCANSSNASIATTIFYSQPPPRGQQVQLQQQSQQSQTPRFAVPAANTFASQESIMNMGNTNANHYSNNNSNTYVQAQQSRPQQIQAQPQQQQTSGFAVSAPGLFAPRYPVNINLSTNYSNNLNSANSQPQQQRSTGYGYPSNVTNMPTNYNTLGVNYNLNNSSGNSAIQQRPIVTPIITRTIVPILPFTHTQPQQQTNANNIGNTTNTNIGNQTNTAQNDLVDINFLNTDLDRYFK